MSAWCEPYEVSLRFRQSVQARIDRLEEDADRDERVIPSLLSEDHRCRQLKLVEAQRHEASRMRELLSHTRLRKGGYKAVS